MSSAQQAHDRLQKFIISARRGRFASNFTDPDVHAYHLAESIIDHVEHIPLEILAGMATFMKIAKDDRNAANALLGRCMTYVEISPRPVRLTQSKKPTRSPK